MTLEQILAGIDPPLDIRGRGRAWRSGEAMARWNLLTPEKFEMIDGRLFWDAETRIKLLAALLENVGADTAVRLGDPAVWKRAAEKLS
jgi:hypothetical protein